MGLRILDQYGARFKRGVKLFVGIDRHRSRAIKTSDKMRVFGRKPQSATDTAVNMKPEPFAFADIRKVAQHVDCPGICCSRSADHAGWLESICPVFSNCLFQQINPHTLPIVGWNFDKRIRAEPEYLECFLMTAMDLIGRTKAQCFLQFGNALFAHVKTCREVTDDRMRDEFRDRSATAECAADILRESGDFFQPIDDLLLDLRRPGVAAP